MVVMATAAAAQPPRVAVSAGAAFQPATSTFTDATTFPYVSETARLDADYDVGDGIAFDIGGQVRVWRALAIGLAVTSLTRSATSEATGSFPHPFFFNTPRTGTWSAGDLDRRETAVHLSLGWEVLQRDRFTLNLLAGPSYFLFDQSVVEGVDLNEVYPYDTIDARLETGSVDGNALGFHAAVDGAWFFTRSVGVGAAVRFTNATKSGFRIGDGTPFDLKLGGVQSGVGIRLRF